MKYSENPSKFGEVLKEKSKQQVINLWGTAITIRSLIFGLIISSKISFSEEKWLCFFRKMSY